MAISLSTANTSDPRIEARVLENEPQSLMQRVYNFVFSDSSLFWIGVGCVGVIASLALGYLITPIFLIGLIPSAIMIILGSIHYSSSSNPDQRIDDSNITRMEEGRDIPRIELPILGVPNQPATNCWAISLMLLILNTPSLENTILNHPNFQGEEYRAFRDFILAYRESQANGERLFTRVPIERIRIALHNLDPRGISLTGSEDFGTAFHIIWSDLPENHPCKTQMRQFIGDVDSDRYGHTHMLFYRSIQRTGFLERLREGCTDSAYRYVEPPQELMITILRHDGHRITEENVPVLEEFDFPEGVTLNGGDGHYVCKSFVRYVHAHYISYFKRNGIWFCCDDDRVTQLSQDQARDAFQKGLTYHYTKID